MTEWKWACNKCGVEKQAHEFGKQERRKDGTYKRETICKVCRGKKQEHKHRDSEGVPDPGGMPEHSLRLPGSEEWS